MLEFGCEVIADGGRRHCWSFFKKQRIVEETLDETASISVVVRRIRVKTNARSAGWGCHKPQPHRLHHQHEVSARAFWVRSGICGGEERPENGPVDHFQRQTRGAPGAIATNPSLTACTANTRSALEPFGCEAPSVRRSGAYRTASGTVEGVVVKDS